MVTGALRPEYVELVNHEDWRNYLSALEKDVLNWFFELDQPTVIAHLMPLFRLPKTVELPLRARFLRELFVPKPEVDRVAEVAKALNESGDEEGALAAIGGCFVVIWSTGRGFDRLPALTADMIDLLVTSDELSALTRAFGFNMLGMGEILGRGDLRVAERHFDDARRNAENAGSSSMTVYAATGRGYVLLYRGDLPRLEVLLFDTLPLCDLSTTTTPPKRQLAMMRALALVYSSWPQRALAALDEYLGATPTPDVPASQWLLGSCHRLLATGVLGDPEAVDDLAKSLQATIVPGRAHFFQSHVHAAMCVACLTSGRAEAALAHAEQAEQAGKLGGSVHSNRVAGYLQGVALAQLGRHAEAIEHFRQWLPVYENAAYGLFAASARVELAELERLGGDLVVAREHLEAARANLPMGANPVALFRPSGFVWQLEVSLIQMQSAWAHKEQPIRICAFGQLRISRRGAKSSERGWVETKRGLLLKSLLAHGGVEVPISVLLDLLWPESEGDRAMNSFKVALSRLKRIGQATDDEDLPWIVSRAGKVSLDPTLCSVDTLAFEDEVTELLSSSGEFERLSAALETYDADVLATEVDCAWVVSFRRRLEALFAEGAAMLAERAAASNRLAEILHILERAATGAPENERLCDGLMQAYIAAGYPSEALRAFDRTSKALEGELGVQAGPKLRNLAERLRREM